MRRRELLFLAGIGLTIPLAVGAESLPRIGFLHTAAPGEASPQVREFQEGLGEAGYVEGKNVTVEYRWAENNYDRLRGLAADLVDHKVDLIIAGGAPPSALAAKNATSTIPILFTNGADPIKLGLVASLAHPGGNVTGVTFIGFALTAKRLSLITELVPHARKIALLVNPDNVEPDEVIHDAQDAANTRGVQLDVLRMKGSAEIEAAFASFSKEHVGALVVSPDSSFSARRKKLVGLASRYGVPAIYDWSGFVEAGGLMSYGASVPAAYRQLGGYAGRILKGAKPADLPVMQPTSFELVINMNAAKALGLTVPATLLARADKVIE